MKQSADQAQRERDQIEQKVRERVVAVAVQPKIDEPDHDDHEEQVQHEPGHVLGEVLAVDEMIRSQ